MCLKYIGDIGCVDGNEEVPTLSIIKIKRNEVEINVNMKNSADLYRVECKAMDKDDGDNKDNDDDEKKESFLEFKTNEYMIKQLKYDHDYTIRAKAKIGENVWSNYSKSAQFKTKKKKWNIDSAILTQNEIEIFTNLLSPQLQEILSKQEISLRLLYRYSRDGKNATDFHSKCNGNENTITLVQSQYNHVFGGFSTKDWSGNSGYTKDDDAFLYLIRSQFNHKPKIYKNKKRDNHALYINQSYGPTWGWYFALCLNEKYSYLGDRYEGAGNELCGGETHQTAKNCYKFDIVEYEVFVVC